MAQQSAARLRFMACRQAAGEPQCELRGALSMTSEERREARRKRRQEKRARAKAERTRSCTLANVASMDSLVSASRRAARGVMWKHSVQRYMAYYLLNAARTRDDILAGRDVRRGFTRFDVVERGKVRHISAPRISERVAQKSLTRNVLTPALVPTATYSNAANIEGRGTEYSIRLMKRHLAANWRKRGRDGYILLMDDAGYFDSLLHGCAKRLVANAVPDAGAVSLAGLFVDAHGERGLGLGSEPDQVLAVCYQNGIDHFIAEMLGVDAFGRYMDDSYCIHESKEYLQVCLMLIERKCAEVGLTLHPTKTRIVKLSRGFVWLKKRFFYSETGRVVVRPSRDAITRERRKLKRMAGLYRKGVLTYEDAASSYQSWRGSMKHLDAHNTVLSMDALFKYLFHDEKR